MKKTLLLFLVKLLLLSHAFSQNNTLKTKSIIGANLTTPLGVVIDNEGYMYVANSYQIRVLNKNGEFVRDISFEGIPFSGQALAISKDVNDNLFIYDRFHNTIFKSNKNGKVLSKFKVEVNSSFATHNVGGIAVAPDGSIYITDSYSNVVHKIDSEGKYLFEFGTLNSPTDVSVGPDGNIYVADTKNKQIVRFDDSGHYISSYLTPGNGAPSFLMPTGVEVDKSGTIYVADAGNTTLYSFNQNGDRILNTKLQSDDNYVMVGLGLTMGIGLDNSGNVFTTFSGSLSLQPKGGKIIKLSTQGDIIAEYGSENAAREKVNLSALEIDSKGQYFYFGDRLTKRVHKYSIQGIKIFEFGIDGLGTEFNAIQDIAYGSNNSVYVMDSIQNGRAMKFNSLGKPILKFEAIPNETITKSHRYKIATGLDHFIYVLSEGKVIKYDSEGKLLSIIALSDAPTTIPVPTYRDLAVDATGNIFVITKANDTNYFNAKRKVKKYSPVGELSMEYKIRDRYMLGFEINDPKSIAVDAFGNLYVAGKSVDIFDKAGNLTISLPVISESVAVSSTGKWVLTNTFQTNNNIHILGEPDTNSKRYLTGTVFDDVNQNQKIEGNEARLKDIIIRALPEHVYGMTDMNGNFNLAVDGVGTYEVSQILPEKQSIKITQTFPSHGLSHSVEVEQSINNVTGINFANRVTLSPYLHVSVSSTRRRRCFESTTIVKYENSGFAPAPDAKVYVQLPAEVELLSADRAFTRLPNGTYAFAVGDLAAGQQGTITIEDIVTCGDESVRGRTVCTRVWITPGNQSPTAPPTAVSAVTGKCDAATGYVRFVIRNTGQTDMETGEQFRIFRDGNLSTVEDYRLAAGDSMVFRVPAMGRTVRLEADQPDGNGDNTLASATVEACRVGGTSTAFSTGFVNAMPTDDEEAEVAEECLPILDSYDPNDKLVMPKGLTEENYTPTGTALRYKIRFQNTGTDVAYRVVVVDTLSEHLDLSTLQIGSASHSYTYQVSGKGRPVLTWTFHNIMLPDSTSDEPGSHGYIQFSIKPKADLPEKTAVENLADIFFDYNSPVRTNTTVNRIYDMPPVINEAVRVNLEDVLATPAIATFEPVGGKYGTEVTITGKRFAANATDNKVYLNGKAATVVSATGSELRVLVPAGATTGALKVITKDGGTTASETFEVYQPPVLSSFSPLEGMVGQTVILQGQHLQPELIEAVKLGNLDCEIMNYGGNSVRVQVPAGATTGTFEISTKGGEAVSASSYVVWYRPAISSLSKETDIVGASITITGENFAADKARNKVLFGQIEAQVLVATPQQLVVRVPEQAASGFITVETPGGQAAMMFEVIPGPGFTAMQPARGSVGTVVEISGQHFGIMGLQDKIAFNGQEALVLEASGDKYKVRVSRGTTTGKVQITGYGGKAYSTADFVVEELTPAEAVQVYPNPNSGRFTLSLQHADFDVQSVEIYDGIGRMIHTTTVDGPRPEKQELQIRSAKPGLYTLHIKSGRGMIIKKVTVL